MRKYIMAKEETVSMLRSKVFSNEGLNSEVSNSTEHSV